MLDKTLLESVRDNGRTDVVKLANNVGVKVKPLTDTNTLYANDLSAFVQHEGDSNFVIYVNPNQSKQRQRFSIAHELGHYFEHRQEIIEKGKVDRESVNSLTKDKERAADKFAAELLMPEDDLRSYIKDNKLNGNNPY